MSLEHRTPESTGAAAQQPGPPGESPPFDEFAYALAVCRDALSKANASASYRKMREPVTVLASAACSAGVAPERVVVELKALLSQLPRFEERDAAAERAMMDQLITRAIISYFAPKAD